MAEKSLSDALQECTTRCQTMDAPLPLRLQAFADDVRNLSPDFADIVDRMVAQLKGPPVSARTRRNPANRCRIS